MNDGLSNLQNQISAFGPLAPAASIVLMVLHSLVPFFPSELITIANGVLFGVFGGILLSWIGGMLGAAAGYAIGRFAGRPLLRRFVPAKHVSLFDDLVRRHGTVGLLVLRLLPVVSFNLINYASGIAGVGVVTFTWTTAVGMIPGTVLIVLSADRLGHGDPRAIWFLVALAALIAGGFAVRRRLQSKAGKNPTTPE